MTTHSCGSYPFSGATADTVGTNVQCTNGGNCNSQIVHHQRANTTHFCGSYPFSGATACRNSKVSDGHQGRGLERLTRAHSSARSNTTHSGKAMH